MKELAIGEVGFIKGTLVECRRYITDCASCAFLYQSCEDCLCYPEERSDGKSVIYISADTIEQRARSMVEGPGKARLLYEAEKLRMEALNMDEASGEGLVAITVITLGIVLIVLFWIMCNAYLGGL